MPQLHELIGTERELSHVNWALREFAQQIGAAGVGAHHVTCSDEAEWECTEAFQRWFAAGVLPELKPACRAPFRTINLGGRYEWGSVRIADEHFATRATHGAMKLMLVKINSHVAVRQTMAGPEYGWLQRYQSESACCGALAAMLEGSRTPAVRELAETFAAGGVDRVAVLRDMARVPVEHRALLAAATNSVLQARRAAEDIAQEPPENPTVYLVLACVTVNRPGPDTEIVLGEFGIDFTEESPHLKYRGLGDDPAGYRVRHQQDRVTIEDAHWPAG